MKKYLSFEHTITKEELEQLLHEHFAKKLDKEDKDFKEAALVSVDFTYRWEKRDGDLSIKEPSIDIIFLCDRVKMRKT